MARTTAGPLVLGVFSPKGGVGKTQTAVTLAHLYSLAGARVLLVDADENRSSHDWTMSTQDRTGDLDVAADEDPRNLGRLRQLPNYDLVVIDLPGRRNGAAIHALLTGEDGRPVVDALVVPSKVEVMDLRPTVRVIHEVIEQAGIPYLFVATMVDPRSSARAGRELDELVVDHRIRVARTVIAHRAAHTEAVATARPITDVPGGRHSSARAAEREYRSLAVEVAELLKAPWQITSTPASDSAPEPAAQSGS